MFICVITYLLSVVGTSYIKPQCQCQIIIIVPMIKRMHYNNITNDDKATVQFAKELISSRDYRVKNLCEKILSFLLDSFAGPFYVINMYNFAM